jgi:pseudouridine synthase
VKADHAGRPGQGAPAGDGEEREERLQKVISGAGLCSRRKAERLMAEGRVTVNGRAAVEPGIKVDPRRAVILVDGRPLGPPEKFVYYMFHKPAGCLTTLDDPRGRPTIRPFLAGLPARVFPVGRLDMDVEGLIILTNDGRLARRLMHPSSLVPKVYRVKVEGLPDEAALDKLRHGRLLLGDRPAAPALAELLKTAREGTAGARAWLNLTLTEGRRRQVKRMCSAIGHPVLKLKRVSYAGLELGSLRRSQARPLTPAEITTLRSQAASAP